MAKFDQSLDQFKPMAGQPFDSDIARIWEVVTLLLCRSCMTEQALCTTSSASFGRRPHISRAMARHSPNPQESGHRITQSTTTLRQSCARVQKRRIKRSAHTSRRTRQRDRRWHNSSSPLSPTHGSESSGIPRRSTLKSPQRTSFLNSKRGAQEVTPSTFWICTTKCSAITLMSRASQSI